MQLPDQFRVKKKTLLHTGGKKKAPIILEDLEILLKSNFKSSLNVY